MAGTRVQELGRIKSQLSSYREMLSATAAHRDAGGLAGLTHVDAKVRDAGPKPCLASTVCARILSEQEKSIVVETSSIMAAVRTPVAISVLQFFSSTPDLISMRWEISLVLHRP